MTLSVTVVVVMVHLRRLHGLHLLHLLQLLLVSLHLAGEERVGADNLQHMCGDAQWSCVPPHGWQGEWRVWKSATQEMQHTHRVFLLARGT